MSDHMDVLKRWLKEREEIHEINGDGKNAWVYRRTAALRAAIESLDATAAPVVVGEGEKNEKDG